MRLPCGFDGALSYSVRFEIQTGHGIFGFFRRYNFFTTVVITMKNHSKTTRSLRLRTEFFRFARKRHTKPMSTYVITFDITIYISCVMVHKTRVIDYENPKVDEKQRCTRRSDGTISMTCFRRTIFRIRSIMPQRLCVIPLNERKREKGR